MSEYDLAINAFSKKKDQDYIAKVKADVFLYWYENDGYDGSGIAVWRNNGEWAYQWLGHCSCYGPLEDIRTSDNHKLKIEDILKIIEKDYDYINMTPLVEYIKRYYLS